MDITTPGAQPSPEQMKVYMDRWNEWVDGLETEGNLGGGHHFNVQGVVLRANDVIDEGPYTSAKESVAGYLLILADDMKEAITLAKKCPILQGEGTSVEVRETASPNQ